MFCKFNIANEKIRPGERTLYTAVASQFNTIGAARRGAPMQAFAELLAVIIRAAIVVVINQLLTLPDSCVAIYAEYLACAVYESVVESLARSAKASMMKGERYRLRGDT